MEAALGGRGRTQGALSWTPHAGLVPASPQQEDLDMWGPAGGPLCLHDPFTTHGYGGALRLADRPWATRNVLQAGCPRGFGEGTKVTGSQEMNRTSAGGEGQKGLGRPCARVSEAVTVGGGGGRRGSLRSWHPLATRGAVLRAGGGQNRPPWVPGGSSGESEWQ